LLHCDRRRGSEHQVPSIGRRRIAAGLRHKSGTKYIFRKDMLQSIRGVLC
jgi:hypothetical protein